MMDIRQQRPDAARDSGQSGRRSPRLAGRSVRPTLEEHIGLNLRQRRQRLNITLVQTAAQSGLSVSLISKVERGQVSPSLSTLKCLCDTLGVNVREVLHGYDAGGAVMTP